ncbi:MAG: GH25 family lysozyme [Alphaproteobacteria bacterium]
MKHVAIALILLCLAACGPARQSRPVGHDTVTVPRFDDAAPHDKVGRAPLAYPVHGIDVSRYQSGLDWRQARASGVNFAFIKATEGGDGYDPMFPSHWTASTAAGVRRGAYHMFYHCRPAIEQARWFITHVPRDATALPPVLDLEWTPTSPTCRIRRPPEVIRAEVQVFVNVVAGHYGRRPILYTAPDFYDDNELWRLSGVDFWLRSVAAPVSQRYPGRPWMFWQYSGTGLVQGIPGKVDLNVFGGSAQDWVAFAGGRR